jgi:hypothetical protein
LRAPPDSPGCWWLARLTQRRCGWHHRANPRGSSGRCKSGKQRVHVYSGNEKAIMGRFGAAGCFAARGSRRGVATPCRLRVPTRLAPPERGGETPSDWADPHVVLWILVQRDGGLLHCHIHHARTGCSTIEVGSRSKDRVHTGSPRAPTLSRSIVRLVRTVFAEVLHPPSSGQSPREHRGEIAGNSDPTYGLGSGARPRGRQNASGVGEHSSQLCLRPAAAT